MILVIGIVIDTCGITLYEMDQEYLDGICNTIVGIQATVFGIVFSMLTLISGFQDKEKYGMPVVKYLTKFRYRFFNQNNVLLIELCLLVISASLLFFGFNNTLFCCFLISLSLIWFLTSEILVLYRIEDIYEEMFNFLKANLHNEQLDLLQKYIDEEKKKISSKSYQGRLPDSRIGELWLSEIEKHSSCLDSQYFSRLDAAFVELVREYLCYQDFMVQQYGLEVARDVLEAYSQRRSHEVKRNDYNMIIEDIATKYEKYAFSAWMHELADIAYSDNPERINVKYIIEFISELDINNLELRNTLVNQFFDVLISKARDNKSLESKLSSFISYIWFYCMHESDKDRQDKYYAHVIHFSLGMICKGYIRIVETKLFLDDFSILPDSNKDLILGVIVCYLYYLACNASNEETMKFLDYSITKQEIFDFIKRKKDILYEYFGYLSLSADYIKAVKQYLLDYEMLYSTGGSGYISMDSATEQCLMFFKMISSPWEANSWIKAFVDDDWYRLYITVVGNEYSENRFKDLSHLMFANVNYKKLEEVVIDVSRSVVLDTKRGITEEEIDVFLRSFSRKLDAFALGISIGIKNEASASTFQIPVPIRRYSLSSYSEEKRVFDTIRKHILTQLGNMLLSRLEQREVYDHGSALNYYDQTISCNFRLGNDDDIPFYDNDSVLRKSIHARIPDNYHITLSQNGKPVIIDAYRDRIGINISTDVKLRKLTDDEKMKYAKCSGDKYRQQIVNDLYFEFQKEEYFKYIDNEYRVLEVSYSLSVDADSSSGTCTSFTDSTAYSHG